MAELDTNVFDKIKSVQDYSRAADDFQLRKQLAQQQVLTGGIDAASKANIYSTQLLSGAAAGGQGAYDQARQHLQSQGIDTSQYAPDVQTAAQQLQAARLAQSPLGTLVNAAGQIDTRNLAYGTASGTLPNDPNAVVKQVLTGGGFGVGAPAPQSQHAPAAMPPPAVTPLQPVDGGGVVANPTPQNPTNAGMDMSINSNSVSPEAEWRSANGVQNPQPTVQPQTNVPQTAGVGTPLTQAAVTPTSFTFRKQLPTETVAAYKTAQDAAFQQHQSLPETKAADAAATAAGSKTGENLADAVKTLNVTQANLPAALKRFQDIRDEATNASSGMFVSDDMDGYAQQLARTSLGSDTTSQANALIKQHTAQGILPELGPQLASAGVKGNKFLEGISNSASGLNLADKPQDKIAVVNGLENQYVAQMKSSAAVARANGQPAPTDEQIDAAVLAEKQKLKIPTTNTPTPVTSAIDPAKASKISFDLKKQGFTDQQVTDYFAAKGIKQ